MNSILIAVLLAATSSVLKTAAPQPTAPEKPYRGAEIYSKQTVKYGRFEMRMRGVRASGTLATFFLYKDGSEQPGTEWEEIDIEIFGKNDALGWQSNIITGNPRRLAEGHHKYTTSFADEFHTFALEWTPDAVTWFVDGRLVRRASGDSIRGLINPQTMRFNIWATHLEDWAGPVEADRLPVYQYVDWMKYSRYEDGEFIPEWTDDFDHFDEERWSKADWTFDENLAIFAPENVLVRDGMLILALTPADQIGQFEPKPQEAD